MDYDSYEDLGDLFESAAEAADSNYSSLDGDYTPSTRRATARRWQDAVRVIPAPQQERECRLEHSRR